MTTVEVFAPAKINLTLHVTGRRGDGYHLLESLVVFARDLGDRITAEAADELSLRVTGPFAGGVPSGEDNLVLKAARLMQRGGSLGARLTVEKNLPHGGGLGGGSADAAGTIKALSQLWGVDPLTSGEALEIGADVPVCLHAPRPALMRGIGEIVEAAPPLPPFWLVLVNPGVVISTGEVFERLGGCFSASAPAIPPEGFLAWLLDQRNDLARSMDEFCPDVIACLEALRLEPGCAKADMSGSGSTCWGMFQSEADARSAARDVSLNNPKWWVRATAVAG